MKILYTCGIEREAIYLTEEQYEILRDIKIYKTRYSLHCRVNGKQYTVGKVLYPNLAKVVRIDSTLYDYRPSNINFNYQDENRTVGISKAISNRNTYFVATIGIVGKQLTVPGYYKSERDAIIARERYIIKNGIVANKRNHTGLSDQEIISEYEKIVLKNREATLARKRVCVHEYALKNNENYGITKYKAQGEIRYSAYINGKNVGSSTDIILAKCIRNLYIVDNGIKDNKIYDVGMTLEEQRKYRTENSAKRRLLVKEGKKYRGLSKAIKGGRVSYSVQVREGNKVTFIGSSQDDDLAAMMYNVYKVKTGKSKEPINDVGLNIKEQIETLKNNGYYMTEDFRFKKYFGNK